MPTGVNKRRKKPRLKNTRPIKEVMISFKGAFRIFGVALLFGSVLFALTLGIERTGNLSVFQIKEIRWIGLKHLKEKEMEKRFVSAVGKNLFRLDIKKIHRRLLSSQWIKEATVRKKFPDQLLIIVVERKPASVEYERGAEVGTFIDFKTAPYIMDTEGVVLQQGGSYPSDLPRLINVNEEAYKNALYIGNLFKHRHGVFIDLSDPEDLQVYFTQPDGEKQVGRLHLGESEYQIKWNRFLSIEADLAKRGLFRWEIDLRFLKTVVVKTEETQFVSDLIYF